MCTSKTSFLSPPHREKRYSADVGANVTAGCVSQEPTLNERLEECATGFGFKVPQTRRLTLGERKTRHLEVLTSHPLHDRVLGMCLHDVLPALLDSISPQ